MKNLVKKLMTLFYWLKNRKKFKNPKKINLSNIFNYAEAEFREWQSTSKFLDCPQYIQEQSIYRLSLIKKKSPKCFENKACINCGCDVIAKTFELDACEGKCYGKRMTEKQWNYYKQINNIKIN